MAIEQPEVPPHSVVHSVTHHEPLQNIQPSIAKHDIKVHTYGVIDCKSNLGGAGAAKKRKQ